MLHRWRLNRPTWFAALFGALALSLAGCSTDTVVPRACPEILIPVDGAKLTRFQPGPGRDIVDVLHEEQVTGFGHLCEYDVDETGVGSVKVSILPSFDSTRGPANASGQVQFEYFIAISDPDKNILDKKRFPAVIQFPANMSRVRWQPKEPINMAIPLKAGQSGEAFQVFLGLQLSREELEYQRKIR